MPKTGTIHMKVDPELIRAVDEARGDVPRSRWVLRAIEARLRSQTASEAPRAARNPSLADTWRR